MQGFMFGPWVQVQPARLLFSPSAERSGLASLTRRLRKVDQVVRLFLGVAMISPIRRCYALRAVGYALFPIDLKLLACVGTLYFSLPCDIYAGGSNQIDAVMNLTADQEFRRHITGVHQVLAWREALVNQGLVDGFGTHRFVDVSRGGMHVCNQMNAVLVTGFAYMNHVTGPVHAAFATVAGLGIVRRLHFFLGLGYFLVSFEAHTGRAACGRLISYVVTMPCSA